jgi:hypothetical protein
MGRSSPEKERTYRNSHREQRRIAKAEQYRSRRAAFFDGKACVQCGSTESLEADHIDPATKSVRSSSLWRLSETEHLIELSKCQALCRRCHWAKSAEEKRSDEHGLTKYTKYGCRCETCKAARSAYRRSYRAKLKSRAADACPPNGGTWL